MATKKSFTGFDVYREENGYTLNVHLPKKILPNGETEYQDSLDYVYESLPRLKKQIKALLEVIADEDAVVTVKATD